MSEVQSRPVASRGRGSGRGGRGGGHSTRGGSRVASRTAAPNGDAKHPTDSAPPSFDDDAELGEIKKKYGSKITIIREVCPGWSEADAAYALDETNGDENVAIDRILAGKLTFSRVPFACDSTPLSARTAADHHHQRLTVL